MCEVEADAETGVVEIARYTSVDDCGRTLERVGRATGTAWRSA